MAIGWSRRKFMIASAVGVGAQPLLAQVSKLVPEARGIPEAKAAEVPKPDRKFDDSKCKGCHVCRIMYSNSMALNNRICWLEAAGEKVS
jgi:hypothetical protein